jgi:low temperature requirement protein LtrA
MWWLYFNLGAERGVQRIQHSHDPGRHARRAYTYIHLPIVAGIIVAAVSDEMVLEHPMGVTPPEVALAIAGGPALYLIGNFLFKWTTANQLPRSHLLGLGLLAISAPSFLVLPPVAYSGLATVILIFVASWEAYHVQPLRLNEMTDVTVEEK